MPTKYVYCTQQHKVYRCVHTLKNGIEAGWRRICRSQKSVSTSPQMAKVNN
ncbi:hypothetical protein [Microcoleus sp. Pol12A6]|uniref:hypothetical protein n=1 Tax=Microcoleus sp. Pol12A6 TaxID=3055393 RepID=UPI002FD28005